MAVPGYMDRILRVDLTAGSCTPADLPGEWKHLFLGGRGLGVGILSSQMSPRSDALAPENPLVLAAGPLTGSGMPLGSRYSVISRSPLSGTLASSNCGGFFGPELKRAGFDAVVIRGRASRPSVLWIHDGTAEIRDAGASWGMTTSDAMARVREDLAGPKARVACIGPAGERLSRMAAIVSDHGRVAGRGGLGAVMGSKLLKAVAAKGSFSREPPDPEQFQQVRDEMRDLVERSGITKGSLHRYGTANLVRLINEAHLLPTRNFRESHFPEAEGITGEKMAETILERVTGCHSCAVACGREVRVGNQAIHGPEYETIWAFGPDCGVSSLEAIARANHLCNELGLDSVSTGATIACAMELSEQAHLPERIRFGDRDAVVDLVRKIGYREGIGDAMAEGSYRFALRCGHPEFSISVKGQELPGYDPRGLVGQGLEYATSVRGACHVYGNMAYPEVYGIPVRLDPLTQEGKAEWTKWMQDQAAAIDSLGICMFTLRVFSPALHARMTAAATGLPVTEESLLLAGERCWNLQKIFNLRAGIGKADDTLPPRLLQEPVTSGPARGQVWQRQPLLDAYYAVRGWDGEGRPTPATLARLALTPVLVQGGAIPTGENS
ncbi:MAG: aldehyde ferredoxin oxidoreductase family protein [Methanomicrobiales archaeon]|nr:aldehyde ferredoxin oxidoreductase family protein [Methanomicrobiales archaeon]